MGRPPRWRPGARRSWPSRRLAAAVIATTWLASSARGPARAEPLASGPRDLQGAAALVVMTGAGLAPARLRVPPATPLVWLNRTAQLALAISFDDAFPEAPASCGERRGFHSVPGHGPFTLMLVPGTVAALCAPSAPGVYPYTVHGEQSFAGEIEVLDLGGDDGGSDGGAANERDAP